MTDPAKAPAKKSPAAARGLFAAIATLGIAAGVVRPWEGLETEPYFDIVNVATVCYGTTGPEVIFGRTYSLPECEALLTGDLRQFAFELDRCVAPGAPMTPQQQAAVLSWAYNVGGKQACSSTLVRKLNAGMPPADWCRELLRWNRAGGKVVRGLTNRRQHEYQICIKG